MKLLEPYLQKEIKRLEKVWDTLKTESEKKENKNLRQEMIDTIAFYLMDLNDVEPIQTREGTFTRTWINAKFPPKEVGRYWCVVEEQNDLGKSKFQCNCSWNPNDKQWTENGYSLNVICYTELAPMSN